MFLIYYGDGSVYKSTDSSGYESRDIQVIVQENEDVGWYTVTGSDYYIWRDNKWIGVDIFGLFDFLLDSKIVLFGRTIDGDEYEEICMRAIKDMNTTKSATMPEERKR